MKTLRVLHLEDNPRDAELLRAALESERFACHLVQVKSKAAFETAVANGGFDLVLSDYALPGYDGLTALALVRRLRPEVPFILVSGTLGEEQAVDSLKSGATDYVLKSRLNRLVPAMRRALCEAEAQAQRRQAEEKLRQSQKLFRQITENVDDLIAVLDLQGRRVFHSPSYHRVLGRPQSLVGTDSFADIHPEDRERIRRIFFQTVASGSGQRAEYRFVLRDGRVRFIESQGSVIRDNGGAISGVLVVSRDITERKRAEEQIREQVALLDKARDAIMVQDLEGRIRYWNKGAARLYGWTATEAIGQYAEKFLFGEMSAQLRDAIRVVTERGEWTGELTQTTKQGKTVTVEGRWTLLLDAAGHPTANLVINTDVTEKKQIEAQFLRAQRLESIGALASGIAHDLNNILSPIMMSAPMLRWRLKPEEIEKTVTSIETSAQRGAELVKQLLTFGRGVEGKRTLVQPKHLLHEMARMVRETFPKNITVHPHIPGELWPLMGDTTQLHQLLLNLCVNARDAMPHGGTLTISAENA